MTVFNGTEGDDSFTGAAGADVFNLQQGGDDTAIGLGSDDVFNLGEALTGADQLNGGDGYDKVVLDGDYGAGVAFGSATLAAIEEIDLTAGHDYRLSGFSQVGGLTEVNGSGLGASDRMIVDASDAQDPMTLFGGQGDDQITGTAGADWITGHLGQNILVGGEGDDGIESMSGLDRVNAGRGDDHINAENFGLDQINGGGGYDSVYLYGGGAISLGQSSLRAVEQLLIETTTELTLDDGNIVAGRTLRVTVDTRADFSIDASAETDGRLIVDYTGFGGGSATIFGGAQGDVLVGTGVANHINGLGGDDRIEGGEYADVLKGGDGDDRIRSHSIGFHDRPTTTMDGGLGSDTLIGSASHDVFEYRAIADSTIEAPDLIIGLKGNGTIDLKAIDADTTQAGNQHFQLVAGLTGHAGELTMSYDSANKVTDLAGDVDGDGAADFLILLSGDRTDFTHFIL